MQRRNLKDVQKRYFHVSNIKEIILLSVRNLNVKIQNKEVNEQKRALFSEIYYVQC